VARIVELCDELVASLGAVMPDHATVSRVYVPEVDSDRMEANERLAMVFPVEDADGGAVSRGIDSTLYTIGVILCEKYTERGDIPNDWADERVQWVEDALTRSLANARERLDGAVPESRETTVFDPELFAEGLFWSSTLITFRDEHEAT